MKKIIRILLDKYEDEIKIINEKEKQAHKDNNLKLAYECIGKRDAYISFIIDLERVLQNI